MINLELRDALPPKKHERVWCGSAFGAGAYLGVITYRYEIPGSTSQWWYLWPLLIIMCTVIGAYRGPSILSEILTKNQVEAIVRALLIVTEAIIEGVLLTLCFEGVELMVTTDVLGGILKLLIVIPFGPLTGILGCIYSLWITIPLSTLIGMGLYNFRKEILRERRIQKRVGTRSSKT